VNDLGTKTAKRAAERRLPRAKASASTGEDDVQGEKKAIYEYGRRQIFQIVRLLKGW
jgi:hypothetical protein